MSPRKKAKPQEETLGRENAAARTLKRVEKERDEGEKRVQALVELATDWYWEQGSDFRFTKLYGPVYSRIRTDPNTWVGRLRWESPGVDTSSPDWDVHRETLERHEPYRDFEYTQTLPDGSRMYMSVSGLPILDDNGKFSGYRGIGRDITRRKIKEKELRESESRFRSLIDLTADWYWEQDQNLQFTVLYGRLFERAGTGLNLLLGKQPWSAIGADIRANPWKAHYDSLMKREAFREFEYSIPQSSGAMLHVSVSGTPIFEEGEFRGYRGIGRDITSSVVSRERISEMAFRDPLTGLANRGSLEIGLANAVQRASRDESQLAIIFIDLDGFKAINDTLGHAAGDSVLIEVARRLRSRLRGSDLIARIGGDEFVVVLEKIQDAKAVESVARKLLGDLAADYSLPNLQSTISGSIGASIFPGDGQDGDLLLERADVAMYAAKQGGKNAFVLYATLPGGSTTA